MGDDITIGVTEIVNNIEVTAQPNDQVVELSIIDNADDVTLNITPTVIEINVNRGSSFAKWGTILGNLPDQTDLQDALNLKADLVGGKVPSSQLPSYVDDVIEVANYAALPATGETGKIYLTLDTNKIYRWSGSTYVEIASDLGYVHLAGTETITGKKIFQNDGSDNAIVVNNTLSGFGITIDNSSSGYGINSNNTSNGYGIYSENASNGIGISSLNSSTGYGAYFLNTSSGKNIVLNNTTGSTGVPFSVQKNSTDVFTINDAGESTGTKFIKSGGTSSQFLKADGSVDGSTYVPTSRTLNINGTSYDLSANRSWTIPTHDAVTIGTSNGLSLSGQVLSLGLASSSANGALSSTDWSTFNSKIGGSGTTNYIPKFTGSTALGDSVIYDDGTQIGIGTNVPQRKLSVRDINNTYGATFSGSAGLNMVAIGTVSGATNGVPAIGAFTNSFGATTNLAINPSGGNVGIGTVTPSSKLHVIGKAIFDIGGNSGDVLVVDKASGGNIAFNINGVYSGQIGAVGSGDLYIASKSTYPAIVVKDGGNVGIGITTPAQKLVVDGGSSDYTPIWAKSSFSASSKYYSGILAGYGLSTNQAVQFGYVYDNVTPTNSFAHITPYGSAEGSKFMVRADGNVGIGTTSPNSRLHLYGSEAYNWVAQINNGLTSGHNLYFGYNDNVSTTYGLFITGGRGAADQIDFGVENKFYVNGSGNVMVNLTSTSAYLDGKFNSFGNSTIPAACFKTESSLQFTTSFWNAASGTVTLQQFVHGTGQTLVGSISSNGSSTSYNTSSDYRLKQDLQPINGLDLVSQIKVYDYEWKSDKSRAYGVLAHELQEVIPQAVNGEKDAEQMQGVDYSKLVPILVQAIQELKAEIEILKQK